MINILLISDQPRLHNILTAAGSLPEGKLRIATALSEGIEEITRTQPDLILLQNRLSGLSGTILVKHVRSSLAASSTKIILLTDGSTGDSTADIELDVSVSDTELSDALCEIIADQLAPTESKEIEVDSIPPLTIPEIRDNVSISSVISKPISSDITEIRVNMKTLGTPIEQYEINEPIHSTTIISGTPPPIMWEKKRVIIACTIIIVLCLIGAAVYLFGIRADSKSKPTKKPVVQSNKPKQPTVETKIVPQQKPQVPDKQPEHPQTPLPGFIPVLAVDPRYPAINPGWERYTSSKREYKVLRDKGAIKAVQILDRSGNGIPPTFFAKVIHDMAYAKEYQLESKEQAGGFLVKKGKISSVGRVILYMDPSDKILHAFVIYFDQ